jgi:hypothetical protein
LWIAQLAAVNEGKNKLTMWPIQTLTLLLCLTDEEQLFAQREPVQPLPVVTEIKVSNERDVLDAENILYPMS